MSTSLLSRKITEEKSPQNWSGRRDPKTTGTIIMAGNRFEEAAGTLDAEEPRRRRRRTRRDSVKEVEKDGEKNSCRNWRASKDYSSSSGQREAFSVLSWPGHLRQQRLASCVLRERSNLHPLPLRYVSSEICLNMFSSEWNSIYSDVRN